ncbi:MAG: cellulose biosynthesis protein BcsS [Xanthobacteraceae bacterium]
MRFVALLRAAVVAAAVAACVCGGAFAQTLDSAAGDPAQHIDRFLWFGGLDAWRNGGFAHGGLLWSPGGLDREGFTAKLMAGTGDYRYHIGSTPIDGTATVVDILPGWRFKRGGAEITVFAGLDIQHHRLKPDDLANSVRGTHAGLRIGADFWWEPTATTMTNAGVSFATVGTGYWARLAYGWRAFDRIYIGPEALALGDDTYHQWRVGVHATAFKTGDFEWSLGTGYVSDSDHRSGPYGRVGG